MARKRTQTSSLGHLQFRTTCRTTAQLIPDSYIVKLKDGASERALQDAIRHVKAGNVKHSFRNSRFKGFAAKLNREALEIVKNLPEVS
jgi:hypothetical protein